MFPDGWDIPANGPLAGLYRFVAVSAPTTYNGIGKPLALAGEVGRGSTIRIAGNRSLNGRRTVLIMNAVSVIELVEPQNVFSQMVFV
jgi:hypothetical protein